MPRQAKPFKYRGWWTTKVGGVFNKLCPDHEPRKTAARLLRELLVQRDNVPAAKAAPLLAVWELCDQFLDFVKLNRAARTFQDYHDCLKPWVKQHGKKPARDVVALDLERWKAELVDAGLSACSVNHHLVAVQTCWNWAVKMDLLPHNPLRKVERLDVEGRQRTLTPAEFRALLRHSDRLFRQVLLVFRLTGVRPAEFCQLTWEQVNWKARCWVIQKHKSRRTAKVKKPRIVFMPPIVENLLRWRLRVYGNTDRVFLNRLGKPWTVNALRCRMRRAWGRTRTANWSSCTRTGTPSPDCAP